MKRVTAAFAIAFIVSLGLTEVAQATGHAAGGAAATSLTEGEVRKVDKEARKLTIRHGPLENLGMPAMSMVFQVKDPAMLDQVKTGDKIRFAADKIGGAYTVTHLETPK
jgi:Cu(I)/Ag(I) efflux system periplasmic protein CusF